MRQCVTFRKNKVGSTVHTIYQEKSKYIEILISINEPIKLKKKAQKHYFISQNKEGFINCNKI